MTIAITKYKSFVLGAIKHVTCDLIGTQNMERTMASIDLQNADLVHRSRKDEGLRSQRKRD